MDVCTIVSRRSLARARVMSQTLREHHEDASLTVLLLDADPGVVEAIPGARLLDLQTVVGDEWGLIAAGNPPPALALAVLPFLVHQMLGSDTAAAIYLGPGQRVTGSLTELFMLLSEHEVALVSRAGEDEGPVGQRDRAQRGAYSRELFGFRAGPSTNAVLASWPRYFMIGEDNGASAVRAWIDSIPARVENVGVVRNPGFGIDPWTLRNRSVEVSGNGLAGESIVSGSRVRAVDFGELDPHDPLSWFGDDDRVRLSSAPILASLAERHASELRAAGLEASLVHETYEGLDDGLRLTDTLRALLVEAVLAEFVTQSPFSAQGRSEFYGYLNQPPHRGISVGLTRLHMAIWNRRPDLRSAYPHIDGPDGEGYAGWLCVHGPEQEGLVPELLPPAPRIAYRDADPRAHQIQPRWGVNVAGFFTSELGVGEAARLLLTALDARRIPALPVQSRLIPPSRQEATFSQAVPPDEAAFPINIICINGDGVPLFAREAGRSFFEGRHTIALWWWEVGAPPTSWRAAYEFIDEVWVASRHIRDAIAPIAPVPVMQITLPVVEPHVACRSRTQLGLPENGFLFLYLYDYHSVTGRKNPVGLVDAFCRAFPPGSGAKLVLKSINASDCQSEHERVLFAARRHPDITVLTDYVSGGEKNAMIAHCDCYVSLHRSEGFGLTPAEAMLLGKPVIATRYGGNLEFMNDDNSCLVDYTLVRVGDGHWPYPPDGVWAEPDLEQAAALMRRVFAQPDYARRVGEAARRDLLARHSPQNAGAGIERRLRLIHERLRDEGHHALNVARLPPLDDTLPAPREVPEAPTIEWGSGRRARLKWRLHRPIADWVRAYLGQRREVDAATNEAITETRELIARLDARLREAAQALQDQQTARHTETQAALRRIESQLSDLQREETRRHGSERQAMDLAARGMKSPNAPSRAP